MVMLSPPSHVKGTNGTASSRSSHAVLPTRPPVLYVSGLTAYPPGGLSYRSRFLTPEVEASPWYLSDSQYPARYKRNKTIQLLLIKKIKKYRNISGQGDRLSPPCLS
ncbi:hypothetical protein QKU89_gp7 [Metaplexis yellow mottle-associated virus]|uniref:Uncharacterized protein n=1 Tax=Metaplexis yellow mottle-associated virus TaxID=2878269 RepID=A0A8K1M6Y9_9VIRU|nr:hypothetical protein QKU89_gp7 [Metaplexis yellow mottle-associated virus]UBN09114.1 hypothetical protein [Metaplexis yellow mottle-associated virus]